jgi:hypothetical protein
MAGCLAGIVLILVVAIAIVALIFSERSANENAPKAATGKR